MSSLWWVGGKYKQSSLNLDILDNFLLVFFALYKLNCLDFCCYFFSELMSIFFMFFLFIYFVCENLDLTNCNWARWSHALPFNLEDTIELIYSFITLYLVEFHRQRLWIDIVYVVSRSDFQNYIHNSNVIRNLM